MIVSVIIAALGPQKLTCGKLIPYLLSSLRKLRASLTELLGLPLLLLFAQNYMQALKEALAASREYLYQSQSA